MAFYKLERLINLHEGYCQSFQIQQQRYLLVHAENQTHLFLDLCPHQQKPLGKQCLKQNLNQSILQCPWHGMRYDLHTGSNPDHSLQLSKFHPSYDGAFVGIELP